MKTLGQRLRHVREELGLSQEAMASELEVGLRTYISYESGQTAPKQSGMARLHLLGVGLDWLIAGKGIPFLSKDRQLLLRLRFAIEQTGGKKSPETSHLVSLVKDGKAPVLNNTAGRQALAVLAADSGVSTRWLQFGDDDQPAAFQAWLDQEEAARQAERDTPVELPAVSQETMGREFVFIPRYDVRASAGAGKAIDGERMLEPVAFRRSYLLERLGCDPEDLTIAQVDGDSMFPTLSDGDLVLINVKKRRLATDRIYAMNREGDLIIKRLQRKFDGSVVIISDNKNYDPETLSRDEAAATLHIVGQLVVNMGFL